ncbi:hypothetical protein [Photobacterium leiognathi]|uniref:hypothetical protein n=1 Tax=Photobacterium leiognathi TaxID=553611 RepID=UPI002981696C|nr:hypothetical protein [Photobacterium leiognathi]
MDHDIISLKSYCQLNRSVMLKIKTVAGCCFDNQAIHLDFGKLVFKPESVGDLVEITLTHLGIEGTGYLKIKDIERLLGIEVKHLDREYLSYIIAHHFAKEGVQFVRYISQDHLIELPLLITCIFRCSCLSTTLYIPLEGLEIEEKYLQHKPQNLPSDLRLSVSWAPFETYLSQNELSMLSSQDLILVYPK